MEDASTQGIINPPQSMNQHIQFSSTCTSSTTLSIEAIRQQRLSPPQVETIDPLIQALNSPRPASRPPQAEIVPPMPTLIHPIAIF